MLTTLVALTPTIEGGILRPNDLDDTIGQTQNLTCDSHLSTAIWQEHDKEVPI